MAAKENVSISWSGGKDCALALYKALQSEKYNVVNLHTTIDYNTRKVGLHGVPETLIVKQAASLNIPLEKVYLNKGKKNFSYEDVMLSFYDSLKDQGIYKIICGDIILEDLRAYKEHLLLKKNLEAVFPLWGKSTSILLEEFINSGFKTKVCAADADIFEPEIVGAVIDKEFRKNLPEGVDPCGENGEFHTFTFDGPLFSKPINTQIKDLLFESHSFTTAEGKKIIRKFYYADFEFEDIVS